MSNTKTIHVPHLGGIDAAYRISDPYDASKPTLILINSFTTSSELYDAQFSSPALLSKLNLLAIELLGHGQTRTDCEHWTYWDTAIMNLQVMDALGIKRAFILGTSQGGWVTVRMALLAPEKIQGIIPLGTSMDSESPRSRALGCWDPIQPCADLINSWTSDTPTPDFSLTQSYCDFLIDAGFGANCPSEVRAFWSQTLQSKYRGNGGRKRIRMAAVNLRDRDTLHSRLWDIRCPVLWMHGTSDVVYSVANAEEEIKMFVNSPDARLIVVEGGQHFLSFSNPEEVERNVLEFCGEVLASFSTSPIIKIAQKE
ncbi:hypothetical protein CISG_06171 [Coccidioides immitis RMSCC 3703]|uniref:AB hydrolase-1 domain-containing protein n=2 Tax=Coccidioides immitis TaxID=5501 RepID=A0A0J8R0G6_COCIT|nr:hypothetical protein CIRG_10045 [Coccidioides immitis RMSCC 2394]KMU77133.1 hypothetical protein CISG_06171 [Coccidioides immitis RMSCC 3703]